MIANVPYEASTGTLGGVLISVLEGNELSGLDEMIISSDERSPDDADEEVESVVPTTLSK